MVTTGDNQVQPKIAQSAWLIWVVAETSKREQMIRAYGHRTAIEANARLALPADGEDLPPVILCPDPTCDLVHEPAARVNVTAQDRPGRADRAVSSGTAVGDVPLHVPAKPAAPLNLVSRARKAAFRLAAGIPADRNRDPSRSKRARHAEYVRRKRNAKAAKVKETE